MKQTLLSNLIIAASTLATTGLMAAETDHSNMDHASHMAQMDSATQAATPKKTMAMVMTTSPLKEPGNDAFGTIQEAINNLDADPNTNWEKVDLEALRQHLVDMQNFTYDVDVLSQNNTEKGTRVVIRGTNEAANVSLSRALDAHPGMLKSETGWTMTVKADGEKYILDIETDKPEEIARLRALGYIGVMALGDHHQVHHWLMAKGANPHGV